MKNIKKVLFTLVFICSSVCFTSKTLADNVPTCSYTFYNPSQGVENGLMNTQYTYMNYVLKKAYKEKFGYEYGNYETVLDTLHNNFQDSEKLTLNIYARVIYETDEGKEYGAADAVITDYTRSYGAVSGIYEANSNYVVTPESCPDLLVVKFTGTTLDFVPKNIYNKENKPLDELVIEAIQTDSEPLSLIFFSDQLKIEMGGRAYVNYAYNENFNPTSDDKNIDPIVEKYLKIDGVKEVLDSSNISIDNGTEYTLDDDTKEKLINNINDFSIIDSELTILNNFNSLEISGYKGLHNQINEFLKASNVSYKSSEWFNKYMPDSKAQYAEALEMILTILNSDEFKSDHENLNYLDELYSDFNYCLRYHYTMENCKSKCVELYRWDTCKDSGNISQCMNSYPSTVCDDKTSEDVAKYVATSRNEIKEHMKDIIDKKLIEYFEQRGIKIETTDFCDILLDKDKENGLYTYIKGILNVIRIGGPILVVLLTAFDAMKSISSFKDDENKKFWNHLKIRIICVAILILVPTIINFIVKLVISEACKVEI